MLSYRGNGRILLSEFCCRGMPWLDRRQLKNSQIWHGWDWRRGWEPPRPPSSTSIFLVHMNGKRKGGKSWGWRGLWRPEDAENGQVWSITHFPVNFFTMVVPRRYQNTRTGMPCSCRLFTRNFYFSKLASKWSLLHYRLVEFSIQWFSSTLELW